MPPEPTEETPTPTRAGTGADLARRMDRMEGRQDVFDTKLGELAATTARVEMAQKHADDMAGVRYENLKSGQLTLSTDVKDFMARTEGILNGDVQTPATRQGQQIVAEYLAWKADADRRLKALEDDDEAKDARNKGRADVFGWGKVALLAIAPVLSVLIALYEVLKP